jgi:hypothetical protein
MVTTHQNKKGVNAEIKSAKLKNEEHISVYKDRLMIKRWKDKPDICLISTTHDDKIVPTRVRRQDMEKSAVDTDYNSGIGDLDFSDGGGK